MILVTVGTHPQGFERLVRAADELAARLEEEMVIQYGSSSYIPRFAARSFDFTSSEEMDRLMKQARIIISHAAAGTIITTAKFQKPIVLAARFRKHHEHHSDHQLELARMLAQEGKAAFVEEITTENLMEAIDITVKLRKAFTGPGELIKHLKAQISSWE